MGLLADQVAFIKFRLGFVFQNLAVELQFVVFQGQAGVDMACLQRQVLVAVHGLDSAVDHQTQGFVDVVNAGTAGGFILGIYAEHAAGLINGKLFQ